MRPRWTLPLMLAWTRPCTALRSASWPYRDCVRNTPTPTTSSPSMTSTQRLTRAMKLRRVMREGGGSEIRADGESPGETTEECARLLGSEGRRTRIAGYLLIPLRATYCWNAVARTHTVERSESIGIGRNVVVDRARRASE